MKQLFSCGIVLFFFLLVGRVVAQQGDVQIKTTSVAGSVSMLEGSGGNIGICAGEDGILMIDDQFAPLSDKIRAAAQAIAPGKELRFLVNTHWHGDHTGGNAIFGKEALILAHDNVRQRLATPQTRRGQTTPASPKVALPVVTYAEQVTVHLNGEEIEILHFPTSHTDGDSVVFFKGSNVVHMGDLFFSGLLPFVDRDSGGDVIGLTRSVAAILERLPEDVKIIPGHGPLSTKDDLRKYHQMLVETTAHVRAAMAADKSKALIQREGLSEPYKSWAWGFIGEKDWVGTIYDCLEAGGEG
jgi:glyoxylase-like metal-dependent hydrolase (beta-lactamase superfamily II)